MPRILHFDVAHYLFCAVRLYKGLNLAHLQSRIRILQAWSFRLTWNSDRAAQVSLGLDLCEHGIAIDVKTYVLGFCGLEACSRVHQLSFVLSSVLRLQLLCINHMQLVHKLVANTNPTGIWAWAMIVWSPTRALVVFRIRIEFDFLP